MKILSKTVVLLVLLALVGFGPIAAETQNDPAAASQSGGENVGETRESVHARRMAQLRRLQDLAVANDRRDLISRVDGLIARELKRHSRQQKEATAKEAEPKSEPVAAGEQGEKEKPEEKSETVSDEELEAEVEAMERGGS